MASDHRYRFSTPPISYVTSVESGGGDSSRSCVRVLPRRHASLAAGILKFFLKLTVSDIAIYNVRRTRPSLKCDCLRHCLRSTPRQYPARRARCILRVVQRHRCVHGRLRNVPYIDARRPGASVTARRVLASTLRTPLDGHSGHDR